MPTLDIIPLRSLVAVANFAGVRRAAQALNLSHAAVSGHLRRLESEIGRPIIVKEGRSLSLTADGQELVKRARIILDLHDEAVATFVGKESGTIRVASTEHAAATLLPEVSELLTKNLPYAQIRLWLTRSEWARQLFKENRADIAIYLTRPQGKSTLVGYVEAAWFGTAQADVRKLVVFAEPCAVRTRAVASRIGEELTVVHEAQDLNDVLATTRRGLGVTPLPKLGPVPDGLSIRPGLPPIPRLPLYLATSSALDLRLKRDLLLILRQMLQQ